MNKEDTDEEAYAEKCEKVKQNVSFVLSVNIL